MKNAIIKMLGGYTEEEFTKLSKKAKVMQNPKAEEFNVGDEIWFYYESAGRGGRDYKGFYPGRIREIKSIVRSGFTHMGYHIDTTGYKNRFAYDFEVNVDQISKDINVLRKKIIMQDTFIPLQPSVINQEMLRGEG